MIDNTPYGKRQASIEYWSTHRNRLQELYPSEEYFLIDCLKKCRSVLDVGCATGGFSELCQEVVPEIDYTGLDVSSNLIKIANSTYASTNNQFYIYEGRKFPSEVEGRLFDIAYSFGVLHHVKHWSKIVKQMIDCSKLFICFDLRLSFSGNVDGYQIIDFNEEWDGKTKIDYCVLDFFGAMKTIIDLVGANDRVSIYGYECSPTDKAVVDIDKVIMSSFCIEKNVKSPRLTVNIV